MEAGPASSHRSILSKRGNILAGSTRHHFIKAFASLTTPARLETLQHTAHALSQLPHFIRVPEQHSAGLIWGIFETLSEHSLEFMGVREKRETIYRYEAGLNEDGMLRQVALLLFYKPLGNFQIFVCVSF